MDAPDNWKSLIEEATKHKVELYAKVTEEKHPPQAKDAEMIKVIAK
jgi:hypothetical protein